MTEDLLTVKSDQLTRPAFFSKYDPTLPTSSDRHPPQFGPLRGHGAQTRSDSNHPCTDGSDGFVAYLYLHSDLSQQCRFLWRSSSTPCTWSPKLAA